MKTHQRLMGSVVFAAVLALTGGPALATPAPPPAYLIYTPVLDEPGEIAVVSESITLDCTQLPSKPCELEVEQSLECPSTASGGCATRMSYLGGAHAVLVGDGTLEASKASARERATTMARGKLGRRGVRLPRRGYSEAGHVTIKPGGLVTLRLRGQVQVKQLWRAGSIIIPAVKARHILLSNYEDPAPSTVRIAVSPKALRRSGYALALDVRFPSGWTLSSYHKTRRTYPGATLQAAMEDPPPEFVLRGDSDEGVGPWRGGVVIGLGSMLERSEFRMRLGYEFAAPEWLLYSVNVDTNFSDDVVLAAHVEASLPTLVYLPLTFAAGIGLPVRVTGEPEVGVRFLLTAQIIAVAFNATIDVYPGRAGGIVETTLSALIMF